MVLSELDLMSRVLPNKYLGAPLSIDNKQTLAELGVTLADILVKFDFTLVNPTPSIASFVESKVNKVAKYLQNSPFKNFQIDKPYTGTRRAHFFRNASYDLLEIINGILNPNLTTIGVRTCDEDWCCYDSDYLQRASVTIDKNISDIQAEIAYGSFVRCDYLDKPSDIDFRVITKYRPSARVYTNQIEFARLLKISTDPEVTFGMVAERDIPNLVSFSHSPIDDLENTILTSGIINIYSGYNLQNRDLLIACRRIHKIRGALEGKGHCEIPVVLKSLCNDPRFVLKTFESLFGEKGLSFEKVPYQENLTKSQRFDAIRETNYKIDQILEAYPESLSSEFVYR